MSSGLLYLVIVAVWACVLVPMWVSRSDPGEEYDPAPAGAVPDGRGRPHPRILARRRRRLTGTVAFLLATVAVAAAGWAPWWAVTVPSAVLVGYLACLRAAAAYDAELALASERDSDGGAMPEGSPETTAEEPARQPGAAPPGESPGEDNRRQEHERRVIDFPTGDTRPPGWSGARDELFDQYDEPRRPAVGE